MNTSTRFSVDMLRTLIVTCLLVIPATGLGNWTLNLGYHNPPNSTFGINFLYFGSSLSYELGVGYSTLGTVNNDNDNESDNAQAIVLGAANIKYFFSKSGIRPYLQGGFSAGAFVSVGEDNQASLNIGGGYAGLGLMFGSPKFYGYLSGNANSGGTIIQLGLGWDI
ncbi:MAG: hypothetical protein CMP10_18645 [Zetaproteobacteria bacterium]|nr:hypothetical protein [Pseudobdellovibrionaceae bacterium]